MGLSTLKKAKKNHLNTIHTPIVDNCIAQIGEFVMAGPYAGYTEEKLKMIFETRKILHRESLLITATTVRVPIPNSHSFQLMWNLSLCLPLKNQSIMGETTGFSYG